MSMKIILLLVVSLLISHYVIAQNSNYKIFLKGGISDYGAVEGLQVSGGHGAGPWYTGPIIGFGLEYDLERNWYLQGMFDYSYNIYGGLVATSETMERGSISVVDFLVNIKKRWNWFYIIGGIGLSSLESSDSYISGYVDKVFFQRNVYGGTSNTVLAGLVGIGIEFHLFDNVGIFLEGSWRLREYVTPVAQLGINYKL